MRLPPDPLAPRDPARSYPDDHRTWDRHPCPEGAVGMAFHPRSGEARSSRLLNLSGEGLALLLPRPARPGDALEVVTWGRSGPQLLLARVVHTQPAAEGWLHGCALENPLPEAELEDLLAS
jgi:hypothetical protein